MALIQYNEFEPKLGPINGRQAQEPRVFAHDAVAAGLIGRINNTDANHGLAVNNYGSWYAVDDVITLSAPAAVPTASNCILIPNISYWA